MNENILHFDLGPVNFTLFDKGRVISLFASLLRFSSWLQYRYIRYYFYARLRFLDFCQYLLIPRDFLERHARHNKWRHSPLIS